MAKIKYVSLSDMHLGADNSLLTNLKQASSETDPLKASPVMVKLAECLKEVVGDSKPTLILNGDILEMALSYTNEAAMGFERFIEQVMPPGKELFSSIVFIPGNHDHHLWEVARETQYVNYLEDVTKPGETLNKPWHVSRIFPKGDGEAPPITYFLTRIVQRYPHLKDFKITTAYPNYGLFNKDTKKCVVFTHGHYIEPLYTIMSKLKTLIFEGSKMPETVGEIEEENFAWIDFFWSAMGRSGDVGEDIEIIYDKMQDPEELKKLLHSLARGLAKNYGNTGWLGIPDKVEEVTLSRVFDLLVNTFKGTERGDTSETLSKDAKAGLWRYVNGPLFKQLNHELTKEYSQNLATAPLDMTIVFGHTHKPYARDENFSKDYGRWVNVYNSGGWVVDTPRPKPIHGGAVIIVDEDLNAASLRMYNEAEEASGYRVSVENASHIGEGLNPLFDDLYRLVEKNKDKEPWRGFSAAAARAVGVRHRNLDAKIHRKV